MIQPLRADTAGPGIAGGGPARSDATAYSAGSLADTTLSAAEVVGASGAGNVWNLWAALAVSLLALALSAIALILILKRRSKPRRATSLDQADLKDWAMTFKVQLRSLERRVVELDEKVSQAVIGKTGPPRTGHVVPPTSPSEGGSPGTASPGGTEAEVPMDHPGRPPPRIDNTFVDHYFREWCETGRTPALVQGLEVVPLRFSRHEGGEGFTEPTPLFKDAPQISEFVRIGPAGSTRAFAFPHPEATYIEPIRYLFPSLTREHFVAGPKPHLAGVQPVLMERRDGDGLWRRVQPGIA